MEFGERLRQVRMARKMTQTELANATSMANTYVSDLENGRKGIPPGESISRLADALQTSADFLLGRSDNMELPEPKTPETISQRLAYLEGQFREAGYTEHDIALIMPVLKRLAPPAKSDE